MVILATTVLALMAAVNYLLGGKRLLYPPVVFCAAWAADLLLVWSAGDFFFPLSDKTLLIFCCGGLAFSLGAAFARWWPQNSLGKLSSRPSSLLINVLLITLLISLPYAYNWVVTLTSGFKAPTLLMAARIAMLDANAAGDSSILFGGIITLSLIVAMIAFAEKENGKVRSIIAIALASALNLLTGGRSGIVNLIFALICIDWLKSGKMRWKPLLALALMFVLVFGAMAILIQKGEAQADAPIVENIRPIISGFVLYAGGGPVGFDQVVRQPNIIAHNWQIDRFFLETANKFGAHFYIPILHADYVDLGPQITGNVYTMYFAYMDLGYVGMVFTIVLLGFVVTLVYQRAVRGSKSSVIIYAAFFSALLLTPFNENFFLGLNFLTKLYAVSWLVYSLPARRAQFSLMLSRLNHSFVPHGVGVIAPGDKTD